MIAISQKWQPNKTIKLQIKKLGPFLFDIYINDIAFNLKEILVKLIAYDITLLFLEREIAQLISKLIISKLWLKFLIFNTNRGVDLNRLISFRDGSQKVMSSKN